MLRKTVLFAIFAVLSVVSYNLLSSIKASSERPPDILVSDHEAQYRKEIVGIIQKGQTLYDIFLEEGLAISELQEIYRASKGVYDLRKVRPNRSYRITALNSGDALKVFSFMYSINDMEFLKVDRNSEGFEASLKKVPYRVKYSLLEGVIRDNLIYAVGQTREHLQVAFELAEIFESEIDFLTDLREGDRFRILVEELWLGNAFKGYGKILAAEFINRGNRYQAYRYELDGEPGYFDEKGRSLRRALLKAPLRFRYISSRFSYRRRHPILRIYRPHLGVDYAAPKGTPVSAAGSGVIKYAGWKGQYGKCVIIRHPNGYETYYGHLSRIRKGIRRGVKVKQGQIIGYVGATGLVTGPHLDYRIKRFGKFINPLTMKAPRAKAVPKSRMADYKRRVENLQYLIAKLQRQKTLFASKSTVSQ